jgi:hypothetical protein
MAILHIQFVAYDSWVYEGCLNVINVTINRASTIVDLAF